MSGWENVKMSEVSVNTFEPLPEGDFIWILTPNGASERTREGRGTEVSVRIAIAEGDLKGRTTFINYPDPDSESKAGKKKAWSAQALKKLSLALGVDFEDGETPVEYLNRVSLLGIAFGASLKAGTYIPSGQTNPKVEFDIWSVRPAVVNQAA